MSCYSNSIDEHSFFSIPRLIKQLAGVCNQLGKYIRNSFKGQLKILTMSLVSGYILANAKATFTGMTAPPPTLPCGTNLNMFHYASSLLLGCVPM